MKQATLYEIEHVSRYGTDAWEEIHSWRESFSYWDFTHPSAVGYQRLLDSFRPERLG